MHWCPVLPCSTLRSHQRSLCSLDTGSARLTQVPTAERHLPRDPRTLLPPDAREAGRVLVQVCCVQPCPSRQARPALCTGRWLFCAQPALPAAFHSTPCAAGHSVRDAVTLPPPAAVLSQANPGGAAWAAGGCLPAAGAAGAVGVRRGLSCVAVNQTMAWPKRLRAMPGPRGSLPPLASFHTAAGAATSPSAFCMATATMLWWLWAGASSCDLCRPEPLACEKGRRRGSGPTDQQLATQARQNRSFGMN